MSDVLISSRQNSMVKYVRCLRDKKARDQEGVYTLEGTKIILEAVKNGIYPKKIIVSPRGEKNPLAGEILNHVISRSEVIKVTDEIMDYMGETESPQGVIATVPIPETGLSNLNVREGLVFVVIDGVQDPGNVGTIIRTADAFGADAVLLTVGCADLYNSKTLRSTMGSIFHIPVIRDLRIHDLVTYFKEKGVFIAATTLGDHCVNLGEEDFKTPLAIVVGSESKGVSGELADAADVLVKIPMAGLAESLNVAVATGIVLYEALGLRGSRLNQTCK